MGEEACVSFWIGLIKFLGVKEEGGSSTKGPGADGLAVVDVIAASQLGLAEDVVAVELDEGLELGHHPCEGDVRELGVVVAATDVGVDAWKPDLFKILIGSLVTAVRIYADVPEFSMGGLPFWIHEASPIRKARRVPGARPKLTLGTHSPRARRRWCCRRRTLSLPLESPCFRAMGFVGSQATL